MKTKVEVTSKGPRGSDRTQELLAIRHTLEPLGYEIVRWTALETVEEMTLARSGQHARLDEAKQLEEKLLRLEALRTAAQVNSEDPIGFADQLLAWLKERPNA